MDPAHFFIFKLLLHFKLSSYLDYPPRHIFLLKYRLHSQYHRTFSSLYLPYQFLNLTFQLVYYCFIAIYIISEATIITALKDSASLHGLLVSGCSIKNYFFLLHFELWLFIDFVNIYQANSTNSIFIVIKIWIVLESVQELHLMSLVHLIAQSQLSLINLVSSSFAYNLPLYQERILECRQIWCNPFWNDQNILLSNGRTIEIPHLNVFFQHLGFTTKNQLTILSFSPHFVLWLQILFALTGLLMCLMFLVIQGIELLYFLAPPFF